jgi:signal transduction histidine kinase
MLQPAIPANENLRLNDLYRYQVLDTAEEEEFNEIVLLASRICQMPISLISLVDADRQWFKAKVGTNEEETPRNISFCGHVIGQRDIFVVPDATRDERFADNPLVTGDMGIQFYAGVPLVSENGHNLGALCVMDKTPNQLSEEQIQALKTLGKQVTKQLELRLRNQQLERLSEAQRRIISVIAHDVRSPLTAISSMLQLLQGGTVDAALLPTLVKMAGQQLGGTLNLVDNMINWGKLQLEQASPNQLPTDLHEVTSQAFADVAFQAGQKDDRLVNQVPPGIMIAMDEHTLRFILRNLLTNAIKFTDKGRITVQATAKGKQHCITVADTGIGMPAEISAHLFGTGAKTSRNGTRKEQGSGLGLILVHEFIENAGGQITVHSREGEGTTFTIALPSFRNSEVSSQKSE